MFKRILHRHSRSESQVARHPILEPPTDSMERSSWRSRGRWSLVCRCAGTSPEASVLVRRAACYFHYGTRLEWLRSYKLGSFERQCAKGDLHTYGHRNGYRSLVASGVHYNHAYRRLSCRPWESTRALRRSQFMRYSRELLQDGINKGSPPESNYLNRAPFSKLCSVEKQIRGSLRYAKNDRVSRELDSKYDFSLYGRRHQARSAGVTTLRCRLRYSTGMVRPFTICGVTVIRSSFFVPSESRSVL